MDRLFSSLLRPHDRLLSRLADMPVPLREIGPLAHGLKRDKRSRLLTSTSLRRDFRKAGGIAHYLGWAIATHEEEVVRPGFRLRQDVLLLVDADSAHRWFEALLREESALVGRASPRDGVEVRGVHIEDMPGLGDEAKVLIEHTAHKGRPSSFAAVTFRRSQLIGTALALGFDEIELAPLVDLARGFLRRIDCILTA